MVKFSKQLEGSLVPEWKGAYCNYKGLKKEVNRIKQDRLAQSVGPRNSFEDHMRSWGSISGSNSLSSHLKRTATGLNPLKRGIFDEVYSELHEGVWKSVECRAKADYVELGNSSGELQPPR